MARVEDLTPEHFVEWGAAFVPQNLLGYAVRNAEGFLVCLGGLWIIEGKAWATFDAKGDPPLIVHRLAVTLLKEAEKAGITEVWAELDETKPKAKKWMERCGFVYTNNSDAVQIWRRVLNG